MTPPSRRVIVPATPEGGLMLFSLLARDCLYDLRDTGFTAKTCSEYDRIYRQFLSYLLR